MGPVNVTAGYDAAFSSPVSEKLNIRDTILGQGLKLRLDVSKYNPV
jgi:hypothetical protein